MNPDNPEHAGQLAVIERSKHPVSRKNISESALKVLYRLRKHGYQSFLVGGAVRDLLLGGKPKDFDIATDAEPDQVSELFRNCRLVGRRFRLAHIRFGREIIEVATFRSSETSARDGSREQDSSGRILRDNVYGSIEDDVWRRDFTVNALYYNIDDFSVWDYVGGVADIEAKTLKLIGDPVTRYKEDPVRMLRAVRFAAKLDFSIDPSTAQPIFDYAHLLGNVPPARLADEATKLFLGGHACRTFALLREYKLFGLMYGLTEKFLHQAESEKAQQMLTLFDTATANTDKRIAEELPVTPAFLIAVFLWPVVQQLAEKLQSEGKGPIQSVIMASEQIGRAQQDFMAIPRRIVLPVREMLILQYRLRFRRGVRALRLMEHPRFRAAYDLLILRAQAGDADQELASWWTDIQEMAGPDQRKAVGLDGGAPPPGGSGGKKRRRRRRPRKKKQSK